jgi:hypothetical protein
MSKPWYVLTERLHKAISVAGSAEAYQVNNLIELHAALDESRENDSSSAVLASCTGKEQFGSFGLALRVCKRTINKSLGMMAYHCDVCKGYHVAGNGKKRRS